MGKLFGTDGVRGIANTELSPVLAFNIGRASAYVLAKENQRNPRIIVGMDTRRSGPMLEAALTAGLCSVGATVYQAGVIPTPGIAYLVRTGGFDAGVVISASHNPMQDNGIKLFNANGYKLPDEWENEIEEVIFNGLEALPRPVGRDVGTCLAAEDPLGQYQSFLTSTVAPNALEGLTICLDCANGATYRAAAPVFEQLGAAVHVIHNQPDGANINADCGSTHIQSLQRFVIEKKADAGFAFDGDGDRLICIDENGQEVDGDEVLSICAHYLKAQGKLKKNTIVATVMSNLGLFLMGERAGITIEKTAVGDRYVLEKMLAEGFCLGGEQSGHIIFLDHNTTGDGILTALQMAAILKQAGKPFSALNTYMEKLPQIVLGAKVSPDQKMNYLNDDEIKAAIEILEQKFAGSGRVLIRPSGTEALIRVMLEGKDQDEIRLEAEKLTALLEKKLG